LRGNCLLKHVIEGKLEGRIEVMGRWGRRRKQQLNDLKEKRGYWNLEEEALDLSVWRTRCGRGCGYIVRLRKGWMKWLCINEELTFKKIISCTKNTELEM
jgi:hypothetical protein